MAKKALEFPTDFLEIGDIYLWNSKLERHKEYQKGIHEGRTTAQSKRGFKVEVLNSESAEGEANALLRVLIEQGVRLVFRPEEGSEAEPLHTVEATFAVEYKIIATPSKEELSEFVKFNCAHNAWPFWRQHVYTVLKQASLPEMAIPFFPPKPKKGLQKRRILITKKAATKDQSE